MQDLKIKTTLSLEDYYNYNFIFYKTRYKFSKKLLWIIPLFISIIAVPFASKENVRYKFFFLIFFGIFLFVSLYVTFQIIYFVLRLSGKTVLKFITKRMYYKKAKSEYEIILSESGIEYNTKDINLKSSWNHIKKIIENEESIYLFFNTYSAFIILKKHFATIEEYQNAKILIASSSPNIPVQYVTLSKKYKTVS